MGKTVNIGGRIHNPEVGNVVAGANEILDDTKGKKQNVINSEVDTVLAGLGSGKQDKLTFDQTPTDSSTNPVISGGVYAADQVLQQAIEAILLLIPSAASALNQLADKSFVNSSIATASATFRGTYNLVSDLHLSVSASHQDIATALASVVATADNNDYCFVQIPTSDTSSDIRVTERYKFNGTAWVYEYDLNNSGFTAQQWAAINSTITSALVGKLSALPTPDELAILLAGKQATLTFDSTPTPGSANPVTSGGLYEKFEAIIAKIPSDASANNKLVAENRLAAYVGGIIGALDATFDLTSTDGHVTLKMTQADGIITSVQILTNDIASAQALTTLSGQVSTNASDIAALQDLYNALQQSAPEIIQPTDTWPVANPSDTVIYRVIDRENTPPEYYSDYMWNGTAMVLMATYNNAIDPRPIKGSANLVISGGVFDNIGALDVSELNATGGTLATYADLSAALAAIPSDYQKGGMSIKFVQTSDNKYVQYRLTKDTWRVMSYDWVSVVNDVTTGGAQNMLSAEMGKQLAQDVNNIIGTFDKQNVAAYTNVVYPYTIKAGAKIYNYGVKIACGSDSSLTNRVDIESGGHAVLKSDISYIQTTATAGNVSFKIYNSIFVDIEKNIDKEVDNSFINLFNPEDADVAIGKYLNANGTLSPSASYNTSGFIPVKENTSYYSRVGGKQFRYINFYTDEKSVISQVGEKRTLTTPLGCSYMRITFYANDYTFAQVTEGEAHVYTPYTPIANYLFNNNFTKGLVPVKKIGKNKLDKNSYSAIIGKYLNPDGTTSSSSSYCVSGFIPFNSGKMIASYNGVPITVSSAYICYFDAGYNCIGSHTVSSTNGVATWFENVAYVMFSITHADLDYAQVEEGELATEYEPFGYYIPSDIIEPEISLTVVGSQRQSAQLTDGEILELPLIYCRRAQLLSAIITGTIPQNGSVIVGRGRNIYLGYYAEITPTEITFAGTTYQHGLTLGNRTFFSINTNQKGIGKINLIANNGGMFEQEFSAVSIGGAAYAQNNTGGDINVELSLELKKVTSPSWMFGDSYFSLDENRWMYYPVYQWGFENFLIDNLPGGTAEQMLVSLKNLCLLGTPQYMVWCLGMNAGTDNGNNVNSSWLRAMIEFLSICKARKVVPILATIPSVPNQPHEALNNWVRNSGYRYIDFAKAVNAQPDGTWDAGLLSSDNVHPTVAGAKVLASRALVDFPEMALD